MCTHLCYWWNPGRCKLEVLSELVKINEFVLPGATYRLGSLKWTLRWRLVGRTFIRESPWDSYLWKARRKGSLIKDLSWLGLGRPSQFLQVGVKGTGLCSPHPPVIGYGCSWGLSPAEGRFLEEVWQLAALPAVLRRGQGGIAQHLPPQR